MLHLWWTKANAVMHATKKKYCLTASVYFFTTCTALNKNLFTPQPKIIKFKLSNQTKEIKMAKVGDKIVIIELVADPNSGRVDPRADEYVGKVGIVERIDDSGALHGTWGSLYILPEDKYEVLQEGDTVHTYSDCVSETVYILPRQLQELLEAVYNCGNANCDCDVDGHSFIGC